MLQGAEATKKALAELAPKARYLHLATHGWFAPEVFKSMRESLEEPDDLRLSLSRAEESVRGFAPETLCGLALAGANHGVNELGKVPGILTAEELATLDLDGCELAVLSACETNVGLRRAGQGIQSLQGALHAAGVRTAITSLWRVDDAATRSCGRRPWARQRRCGKRRWRCAGRGMRCATGRHGCSRGTRIEEPQPTAPLEGSPELRRAHSSVSFGGHAPGDCLLVSVVARRAAGW